MGRTNSGRLLGAVVVVAVLILATALARLIGPGIAGQATIEPVDGPPTAGDCVAVDPFSSPAGPEPPSAQWGACDRPHFGEVVLVVENDSTFPRMEKDQHNVPDPDGCTRATAGELGLSAALAGVAPWVLVPIGPVGLIGPDQRQRADGQHWIACLAYSAADGTLPRPLRDLFDAGALPPSFGGCTDGTPHGSCRDPHSTEGLADVELTYALPPAATLAARCAALVAVVTRMPDVTAGGALRVVSLVNHYDVSGHPIVGYPTAADQPATASCGLQVTGSSLLTSTLIGLGTGPLPVGG